MARHPSRARSRHTDRDSPPVGKAASTEVASSGILSTLVLASPAANPLRTILALTMVILLGTVAYGHLWWRGEMPSSEHSDMIAYNLGVMSVLHDGLSSGDGVPAWRSDQFSGYPAISNPQALYLYPFHFFFYLLEPTAAVGPTFWLHFLFSGLAFYWLASVLELSLAARMLAALAGLFNFKLIIAGYAGWLPVIPIIVLMPALLAAFLMVLRSAGAGTTRQPGRMLITLVIFAIVISLCVLSGGAQLTYYLGLFLAAAVLMETVRLLRTGRPAQLINLYGCLSAAALLSLALTAPRWLPTVSEARLISRSETTYDFLLSGHCLAATHLKTFFHPEALGTPLEDTYQPHAPELWEDVGYFGLVPLLLALAGGVLARRRKHVLWLSFSFLISILLAADTPFLKGLFYILPGFGLFRCPGRFLFVSATLGILLGAVGLDELLRRLSARPQGGTAAAALLALCLCGFVTVEGIHYAKRYLPTAPVEQVIPHTDYRDFFARDHSLFRVAPAVRTALNYGWAAPFGVQLITGYDAYNLRHYLQYFDIMQYGAVQDRGASVWTDFRELRRTDLLDALNVKYLISERVLEQLPGEIFPLVASFKNQPAFRFYLGMEAADIYIQQNLAAMPRAFWAKEIIGVADEAEMISLVQDASRVDARRTAVILNPAQPPLSIIEADGDAVEIVEGTHGRLRLKTRSASRRYLLFSEIWHPGWQASLDGSPLEVDRANLALMGAWIPDGVHELELTFRPLRWPLALYMSGIGCASLLLLFAVGLIRKSRREGRAG